MRKEELLATFAEYQATMAQHIHLHIWGKPTNKNKMLKIIHWAKLSVLWLVPKYATPKTALTS